MSICIECILEREIPDAPLIEGKALALVYCGNVGREDVGGPAAVSADIIPVDFGGAQRAGSAPEPAGGPDGGGSLLAPLEPFIAGAISEITGGPQEVEWHEAAEGLVAVGGILEKLRAGAVVTLDPDMGFDEGNENDDLSEWLQFDLEQLAATLTLAKREGIRFYLAFDV